MYSLNYSLRDNHCTSDDRCNHYWHAFENGLQSESHGAAISRQGIPDDCKYRGRSHALPCHNQSQPDKNERPGGSEVVDKVTSGSKSDEDQEGATSTKPVGYPAA